MIGLNFGINKAIRSQVLRNDVTKKTRLDSKKINKYNGLSRKEEFLLEKTCLEKINSNFKCLCNNKARHFPQIVSSSNGNLKLSNCGISLNNYKNYLRNKEIDPIKISDLDQQIDCIL